MNKHALKTGKSHRQVLHRIDLDRALEILSAFDRGVVELSMGRLQCVATRSNADAAAEPAAAPGAPEISAAVAEATAADIRAD